MAWVLGIKEARIVQPEREGKSAIPKPVRQIVDLSASAISRTVTPGDCVLPDHTGAGPCGTLARAEAVDARVRFHGMPIIFDGMLSPLAWSITHLVVPLRAYYAVYEAPVRFGRFGSKAPRFRRCA
jgi:hypothetical protein